MDADSVADELFLLRPEEFTAARDRLAARAVRDGDRELARRLKALRRPTLAAWVCNLLVRNRPDEARALIRLGEGLREAHRTLDGGELRELGRRQRVLVASLSREARRLAEDAGHRVGDAVAREVEETLYAVLADPGAAEEWVTGRLSRPLAGAPGFPGLLPGPADRLAAPPSPAPPGREAGAEAGEGAEVADLAEARERRVRERRRDELGLARRRAERAAADVRACETELARVREAADRAERDERTAGQRLTELTAELDAARARRSAAEETVGEVRDRLREAERAWRAAREAAEAADVEVDRLR
ncbi:hypothetical protein [Streptomyces sp. UNOB3_S3]|uniref:hypothetical protein n=1 Tax=Streptomyces sp. UNOB3_S3 TaxID=2871682 RepID=UPI001E3FE5C8|nr:hypothetical protein [Streptomyces sp. UNOB3_S3]MCC3775839.1 hypothetical protein [Streptomyces sp. UNOB3_S3]